LNSTSRKRLAQLLGVGLMALAFYAMLSAIMLVASFALLQKGIVPDWPWISSIQKNLYKKATRTIWQHQIDCVDFDDQLIYKPKIGACKFSGPEFNTTLNFSADGRFTGTKPAGTGIAVIGDSHAMGWGVQDQETFAAELQKLTHRPVYNLGVASYGTVREVLRLEKSGLLDKVDTVIIQYMENDRKENERGRIASADENRKNFEKITKGKSGFSALLGTVTKAYRFALTAPFRDPKARYLKPKDFSRHYPSLMAVLEKHTALRNKRVLIFYSNGNGQPFKAFPKGKDKSLPNVEFQDLGLNPGDYYRIDDHLTPAGHRKTAQQLFKLLDAGK
jgi:hypothetical protein